MVIFSIHYCNCLTIMNYVNFKHVHFAAERRIRVHTLCIPVTDNLNDVFHNADQQAITCLIAKMGKY